MTDLLTHGPIKISPDKTYLVYRDGTPFLWLADTWWFGATGRMPLALFTKLAHLRKRQGFSVIQIVIGPPPEVSSTSLDAANSKGLPLTRSGEINTSYFDEVDKKIDALVTIGLVPCIVGSWGYHIQTVGTRTMQKLWQEIITRYAHLPVVFCVTGEIDYVLPVTLYPPSLVRSLGAAVRRFFPFFGQNSQRVAHQIQEWKKIASFIRKTDPFHRPLLVHPHTQKPGFEILPGLVDIDTIQSGHSISSASFMGEVIQTHARHHCIMNLEPWYEGILGNFGPEKQRYAWWLCVLSGAKGHSYGAHGIWNMSQKDKQFLAHWGTSSWQEAKEFEGAKQIGRAATFLKQYPWWQLQNANGTITPHWAKDCPNNPIAGIMSNRYMGIYIPAQYEREHILFSLPTTIRISSVIWYDPTTMKRIAKQPVQKKTTLTLPQKGKDWLIWGE